MRRTRWSENKTSAGRGGARRCVSAGGFWVMVTAFYPAVAWSSPVSGVDGLGGDLVAGALLDHAALQPKERQICPVTQ